MKNVFEVKDTQELKLRIERLSNTTKPNWGKMNASQMLSHCNVVYDMTYQPNNFKKPNSIKKWLLKTFLKPIVVGPKPFKKNGPTAPEFKISEPRDFENEKKRIINYINQTQQLGKKHFENKENLSFGVLTSKEWNNLFYKHLDHHLNQFGV